MWSVFSGGITNERFLVLVLITRRNGYRDRAWKMAGAVNEWTSRHMMYPRLGRLVAKPKSGMGGGGGLCDLEVRCVLLPWLSCCPRSLAVP